MPMPVALQVRPGVNYCGHRRGQDHAPHRPGLGARPHCVQRSSDGRLDLLFLSSGIGKQAKKSVLSKTTQLMIGVKKEVSIEIDTGNVVVCRTESE
jgi:hypothetical protein